MSDWTPLVEVLSAQADELRALVPLLDEQQAALTRADSAAVAAVLVRQDPILRRFHRLEDKRRALVASLAARIGVPANGIVLSALVARIPDAPAVLATLRAELRSLLEAADVRNRRNAFLLSRLMASIEGLVRAVTAPAAELAPVYVASGRPARRGGGPRLVDRSA